MKGQVKLKTFANPVYDPVAGILKRLVWYVIGRIFINTYFPFPQSFKIFLLQKFGAKIDVGLVIKPKVNIKYPWLLSIGDNTWIGEQVWIDNLVPVAIGNNCCLSQGAMLLTGNHDYKKSSFDLITGKITLEEGVWVGAKAIVCPGVTMASHSIASVGSIISKNTEPYGIYAGNPASKIRMRNIA